MTTLCDKINALRDAGLMESVPLYIKENLNPNFFLREYQIYAFENFITYFENPKLRTKPTQCLFHMATGSGKTLIMAGLMLYLYKNGYRNFLFFVNLNTIIKKTEDNFLNNASTKYLFSDEIIIDGEKIRINHVNNFQDSDENAINICFTSTQGLHSVINNPRENAISENDFENQKIVFISDESHHLNSETKKKLSKEENEDIQSWERTVKRLYQKNNENILLQFTATAGLEDPLIKAKYEDLIIYDYALNQFYIDKYSKEIKTLKTNKDSDIMARVILALILSQYRLKIFQENKIYIKPVVLLKSKLIKECDEFQKQFHAKIKSLTADDLSNAINLGAQNETVKRALDYMLIRKGISLEDLVKELQTEFSEEHCISANDKDAEVNQLALNSLEDKDNPYRLVFEVKKLDEGWDVLNLFDIVRLYSDRQPETGHKTSKFTQLEAQLIGRGARYCPFLTEQFSDPEFKFKRKFDSDTNNDLKICEELFYHCQNDSKYITELRKALKEIGLTEPKYITYKLKNSFKNEELYNNGKVFYNKKCQKDRSNVSSLNSNVFGLLNYNFASNISEEKLMIEEDNIYTYNESSKARTFSVKDISNYNYSIINKAIRHYPNLHFNILKRYFPQLNSTFQFITDDNYLGQFRFTIRYPINQESNINNFLYQVCLKLCDKLSKYISSIEYDYEGTTDFFYKKISDVFKDKTIVLSKITDDGQGSSQNDSSDYQLNLSQDNMEWFVYNDNYGTSEEKAFVKYFYDNCLDKLREKFTKVFLVRNERSLAIYSFKNGERFEPDYLLFLQNKNHDDTIIQYQLFIEPKGGQLLDKDKWKQDFLEEIHVKANLLANDENYNIWGLRFFNSSNSEFSNSFDEFYRQFEFKTVDS